MQHAPEAVATVETCPVGTTTARERGCRRGGRPRVPARTRPEAKLGITSASKMAEEAYTIVKGATGSAETMGDERLVPATL